MSLALALLLVGTLESARAEEVLIDGLAWRQLTDTAGAGLSWNDVASVCPLDETPCAGTVNGVEFTGWVWASAIRVNRMLDTLTGLKAPVTAQNLDSSIELFFDKLHPIFETESGSAKLSFGLFSLPEVPADSMVDVLEIRDASTTAGSDRMVFKEIAVTDTEVIFFGPQPLGVFLVRDPAVEICDNGIDDDGDGQTDIADESCEINNTVIDGVEWRQVTATAGIHIYDVAAICPGDGTPCSGTAGGTNFDDWIWANSEEVAAMIFSLTGYEIGNTTDSFPGNSSELPAVFTRFSRTLTSGGTRRSLYAYTANSMGELGNGDYPDISFFIDPSTCLNGIDDDGDGKTDAADVHCLSTEWFVFSDSLDSSGPDVMGTQGGGSLQNDFRGYFLRREPLVVTPEVCDNTLDDDRDGLVDGLDTEDCDPAATETFIVSCIHDPVYAAVAGGEFTLKAEVLDAAGEVFVADTVEIWTDSDESAPQLSVNDASVATYSFTPAGHFSYACSATDGAVTYSSGWRRVTNGPFMSDFPATPILLNGAVAEKIDIVFFPDQDEYTSPNDPAFARDVGLLIKGGYFTVPWFIRNQSYFNFWLGKDTANSGPNPDDDDPTDGTSCLREAPDNYGRDYSFADAGAIVHPSRCRDNAGSKIFTVEVELARMQVLAHETGHRPFGFLDEYCCDGGYRARKDGDPPYHNLFANKDDCSSDADERGYDSNLCRAFIEDDSEEDWWIFEADFNTFSPEQRDLMQQTGCDSLNGNSNCRDVTPSSSGAAADPDGVVACASTLDSYEGNIDNPGAETYWLCTSTGDATSAVWRSAGPNFQRYDPGPSELDRMRWFLDECDAERC